MGQRGHWEIAGLVPRVPSPLQQGGSKGRRAPIRLRHRAAAIVRTEKREASGRGLTDGPSGWGRPFSSALLPTAATLLPSITSSGRGWPACWAQCCHQPHCTCALCPTPSTHTTNTQIQTETEIWGLNFGLQRELE